MRCRSIRSVLRGCVVAASLMSSSDPSTWSALGAEQPVFVEPQSPDPTGTLSTREQRAAAIAAVPTSRLTPAARDRIHSIVGRPTFYRHLPTQVIDCDPDLFICITRQPELLVGIWEVMGITHVKTKRLDDYRLLAHDGSGTTCTIDLVYGDRGLHVFVADGYYDGKLVASKITGKGVFVLRTKYEKQANGLTFVEGTLDCFVQLDNLGADLIARTFGPLIGKTADHNYIETAKFVGQLGISARENPLGVQDLGARLPQVNEAVKVKFIETVGDIERKTANQQLSKQRTAERKEMLDINSLK